MLLNTIFTADIIAKRFISLMCCLKCPNNFINCYIPAGRTIGSSIDVPNYILHFWYPNSILPPTISTVGSNPTHLCGLCHALATVSGRHGADGSALDRFCYFMSICLSVCGAHHFPCNGPDCPSLDTYKVYSTFNVRWRAFVK